MVSDSYRPLLVATTPGPWEDWHLDRALVVLAPETCQESRDLATALCAPSLNGMRLEEGLGLVLDAAAPLT